MKRILLIAAFLASTTGCGIGLEDSAGPNVDTIRKNEKLRGEYEAIKGVYVGTMKVRGITQPLRTNFYVYWSEVQERPEPGTLKPEIRVVLRGRLVQQDFIGESDNLILIGQYSSLDGSIRLDPDTSVSVTPDGCQLGGQEQIAIKASLNDGRISGTVEKRGQDWGTLNLVLDKNEDVSRGAILNEEDEFDRLQEFYNPVVGTYEGEIERNVCGGRKESATFTMYVERVPAGKTSTGLDCYKPTLFARMLRHFEGPFPDERFTTGIKYNPVLQTIALANDNMKATGTIDGKSLVLELSASGPWGVLNLKKASEEPYIPIDEDAVLNERLTRTYNPFVGTYEGSVKSLRSEFKDWKASMRIYIDSVLDPNSGRIRPALRAYYKRLNFTPGVGERILDITYNTEACVTELLMETNAANSSCNPSVPKACYLSFNGTIKNGVIEGMLANPQGPHGQAKLMRK